MYTQDSRLLRSPRGPAADSKAKGGAEWDTKGRESGLSVFRVLETSSWQEERGEGHLGESHPRCGALPGRTTCKERPGLN